MRPRAVGVVKVVVVALGVVFAPPIGWAVEGDVTIPRKGAGAEEAAKSGTPPAVFPHWIHRIRYKCYACHPAVFEMKAGSNPITMDAITDGKFCGICHDGKTAWSVGFETCNRCHVRP